MESAFLEAVSHALTEGLEPHFTRDPSRERSIQDLYWRGWTRDLGWKRDAVEISYPRKEPDGVLVHLRVYLPCPEGEETLLDGTSVAGVIGGRGRHSFPNLFGRPLPSRANKFGKEVLADTLKALPWFERYSTPEACLRLLEEGETNWGQARGRSYRILKAYLSNLEVNGWRPAIKSES